MTRRKVYAIRDTINENVHLGFNSQREIIAIQERMTLYLSL